MTTIPMKLKLTDMLPPQFLMGCKCWIKESQTIDGVQYELFEGYQCAFIRVTDVDSNNLVLLTKYPAIPMADCEYERLMKIVRHCTDKHECNISNYEF